MQKIRDILVIGVLCILSMIFIATLSLKKDIKNIEVKTVHEYTIIIEEKEKVKVVEEEENKYPITDDERELISRIIAAESRGEPLEGQIGVAQVILDRWIDKGGTLDEIILAPKQFADPYSGDLSEYPNVWFATHLVFDLGHRIFEGPTLYFFNPKTSDPSQVELLRSYKMRGMIGNHEFRGVD